jgi:hypothetical protein
MHGTAASQQKGSVNPILSAQPDRFLTAALRHGIIIFIGTRIFRGRNVILKTCHKNCRSFRAGLSRMRRIRADRLFPPTNRPKIADATFQLCHCYRFPEAWGTPSR